MCIRDRALAVRAVGGVRFGATATKSIMEDAYKKEAAGTLVLPVEPKDLGPSK